MGFHSGVGTTVGLPTFIALPYLAPPLLVSLIKLLHTSKEGPLHLH
eukprot:Gb_15007 [translate_table: standard]